MKLPNLPTRGKLRSRIVWVAYPNVRKLTLNDDANGLLTILDAPRSPDEGQGATERALAACALGSFPSEAAVRQLARLIDPAEATAVRGCAADSLRRIGGDAASSAVARGLNDENWLVQNAAAKTLRESPRPDAAPLLAAVVEGDSGPLVRSNAAEALGAIKSDAWIPLLTTAANDPHFIVALGGAGGLGDTESEAALEALRALTREGRLLMRPFQWLAYWKLRRILRRRRSAAAR